MIVDLDKILYVVDEKSRKHRVSTINIREKVVICEDGTEYPYSTCPLTVIQWQETT